MMLAMGQRYQTNNESEFVFVEVQARIEQNKQRLRQLEAPAGTEDNTRSNGSESTRKKANKAEEAQVCDGPAFARRKRKRGGSEADAEVDIAGDGNNMQSSQRSDGQLNASDSLRRCSQNTRRSSASVSSPGQVRLEWKWRPQANAMPSNLPNTATAGASDSACQQQAEDDAEYRQQLLHALRMSLDVANEGKRKGHRPHLKKAARDGSLPTENDMSIAIEELDPNNKGFITQADVLRAAQRASFLEWTKRDAEEMVTLFSSTGDAYLWHEELRRLVDEISATIPNF